MAILAVGGTAGLMLLLLVLFPPRDAPRWWRRSTRPVRRLLRPGHYRTW